MAPSVSTLGPGAKQIAGNSSSLFVPFLGHRKIIVMQLAGGAVSRLIAGKLAGWLASWLARRPFAPPSGEQSGPKGKPERGPSGSLWAAQPETQIERKGASRLGEPRGPPALAGEAGAVTCLSALLATWAPQPLRLRLRLRARRQLCGRRSLGSPARRQLRQIGSNKPAAGAPLGPPPNSSRRRPTGARTAAPVRWRQHQAAAPQVTRETGLFAATSGFSCATSSSGRP